MDPHANGMREQVDGVPVCVPHLTDSPPSSPGQGAAEAQGTAPVTQQGWAALWATSTETSWNLPWTHGWGHGAILEPSLNPWLGSRHHPGAFPGPVAGVTAPSWSLPWTRGWGHGVILEPSPDPMIGVTCFLLSLLGYHVSTEHLPHSDGEGDHTSSASHSSSGEGGEA